MLKTIKISDKNHCFWIYETRNKNASVENIKKNLESIEHSRFPESKTNCFSNFSEAKKVLMEKFTAETESNRPFVEIIFYFPKKISDVEQSFKTRNKELISALQPEIAIILKRDIQTRITEIPLEQPINFVEDIPIPSVNPQSEIPQDNNSPADIIVSFSLPAKFKNKIVLEGNTIQKIPYMDKPPALDGQLRWLSHQQFYEKFQCYFFEGLVSSAKSSFSQINRNRISDNLALAAYDRLQNPLDCFVICNMGEEVGYALFAFKDISAGTVLCIYSGEDLHSLDMRYVCDRTCAKQIGGFSRFMQHLPIYSQLHLAALQLTLTNPEFFSRTYNFSLAESKRIIKSERASIKLRYDEHIRDVELNKMHGEYDLDDIEFNASLIQKKQNGRFSLSTRLSDGTSSEIAYSNVMYNKVDMGNGMKVNFMEAMADIKAGEMVGFSYGRSYWQQLLLSQQPFLFTPKGEIIKPEGNYIYPGFKQLVQQPSPCSSLFLT